MLENLNIIKDCWWTMPSGDAYVTDENNNLSSVSNALYESLNSNTDEYIKFSGSGIASYYGRIESTNIDPSEIHIDFLASGDHNSADFYINNIFVDDLSFTNNVEENKVINLTDTQKQRIFDGRIKSNYSYFNIDFPGDSGNVLYNLSIAYSGDSTWDNHETGLPNVITSSVYPSQLGYREDSVWMDSSGNIADSNSTYYISQSTSSPNDSTYLEQTNIGTYKTLWYDEDMPTGGLSLYFPMDIDPLTSITRAQMSIRVSVPVSGDGVAIPNNKDTFEIHGYNSRYKNQDYREEIDYLSSDVSARNDKYGYFLYGAGEAIGNNEFANYDVELNFLDPNLPSGNLASVYNRNVDMLSNMEFQFVGLPSGTKLSAAELTLEYISNNCLTLHTLAHVHLCNSYSTVDAGTDESFRFGNGGWHHIAHYPGESLEERVFDNFYRFDEPETATRIYPEKTKQPGYDQSQLDTTVYADYVRSCPRDEDEAANIYGRNIRDGSGIYLSTTPEKREYYRNPLIVPNGTNPTYYSHMDYHGDPIVGNFDDIDVFQPYFHDRIDLGRDFTLYFMLYREYGRPSYGKFFERGPLGTNAVEYEIIGKLFPDRIQFDIVGVEGGCGLDVPLEANTAEPILVWLHCGYESVYNSYTTAFLNVHDNISNYFGRNWKRDSKNFYGQRKQYSSPRTILGTMKDIIPANQDTLKYYYRYFSMCEFGYKNRNIYLNHNLTNSNTYTNYDTSTADDKEFISTRLSNNSYLHNSSPSGIRWSVPDGSGEAYWMSKYLIEDWTDNNYQHSLLSPITTAGTNYKNYKTGNYVIDDDGLFSLDDEVLLLDEVEYLGPVLINLRADHNTNHPSGAEVYVDIGFNTSTEYNKYLTRSVFTIPSGDNFSSGSDVSKHINFNGPPIKYSDIESINLLLHTRYPDLGDQEYYGTLDINTVDVYFDSYCVPQTGLQDLDLVLYGGETTLTEDLYLYTQSHLSSNESIDLYTSGRGLYSSGNIPLYINSDVYIAPPSLDRSKTYFNLFIDGLDPPVESGILNLHTYVTENSGINNEIPFYISSLYDQKYTLPLYITTDPGEEDTLINLYIENTLPKTNNTLDLSISGPSGISTEYMDMYVSGDGVSAGYLPLNSDMNLFMARDTEGVADRLSMYIHQDTESNDIPLVITGAGIPNSSVPLYLYNDEVASNNNNVTFYTHGF